MAGESGSDATPALSPEEALTVLGNETRLQILRTLGETGEPLTFTELFDRVDYEGASNFNYHLKQLAGHFIQKTDDKYVLRQAGRRVIGSVFAEARTEDVDMNRTPVDWSCFLCGAPGEVSYRDGHVGLYCSACGGTRDETSPTAVGRTVEANDVLGYLDLPPAGAADRTPLELIDAATVWGTTRALGWARGVCSACSASLERSVTVCENHEKAGNRCDRCGQRFAVSIRYNCTNCIFNQTAPFSTYLLDNTDLVSFMTDHGIDPLGPNGFHMSALDETIHSTDPFEARFTFTADDESISLTVDDDLSVVDVSRRIVSNS